jgi:hypothetical protein
MWQVVYRAPLISVIPTAKMNKPNVRPASGLIEAGQALESFLSERLMRQVRSLQLLGNDCPANASFSML